jgi:hypothetical protein
VKKLWTDRIAVVTAGVGILLMVLTWVWRVNPVEGSVMPDFLTSNPFGLALTFVLLGTCMPVLIVTVVLGSVVGLPESDALPPAIILQGIVFLMLGRLISVIMAHFRGRA